MTVTTTGTEFDFQMVLQTPGALHDALQKRKAGLIAYCQIKLDAGDWHAVQDAASDIREIDAKLELLKDGK